MGPPASYEPCAGAAPGCSASVEADEVPHPSLLSDRVRLARVGRSGGLLIGRHSGRPPLAHQPAAGQDLPVPAMRGVSHGPSSGERDRTPEGQDNHLSADAFHSRRRPDERDTPASRQNFSGPEEGEPRCCRTLQGQEAEGMNLLGNRQAAARRGLNGTAARCQSRSRDDREGGRQGSARTTEASGAPQCEPDHGTPRRQPRRQYAASLLVPWWKFFPPVQSDPGPHDDRPVPLQPF
jgi:hypothetical protein